MNKLYNRGLAIEKLYGYQQLFYGRQNDFFLVLI